MGKHEIKIVSEANYGPPEGRHDLIPVLILCVLFTFPVWAVFLHWLFN